MGCFSSSKRDKGYDSGYSSANSSRSSSASRSTTPPSGRSTVPVRFAPRPAPQYPPEPLPARPPVPDGPISLTVLGKRVHRVRSDHPGSPNGDEESLMFQCFRDHRNEIHTLSDFRACIKTYRSGESVRDERMKHLLRYYFDIYFVDNDHRKSSNPRLYKLERRDGDMVVQNGCREPPGFWFGD